MRHAALLIFGIILLYSCSSSKNSSVETQLADAPEWVRKSPNDAFYYHGVGSALKTNQMDYREKAKQNALSDIAGNISVNISSTSVLNQYEFNNKFSDYYKDNIKVSAKNYLEGYEQVDSWENKERYWVYYRLSKSEYERIRLERIQTAQSKSEGDYREALKSLQAGNSSGAITNAVKAIEKIKDFLGEDLQTTINGQSESYTSRIFADLSAMVQQIRIVYPATTMDVSRGQKPVSENLETVVQNESGQRLSNIPVVATYSYSPGKRDELTSDAAGTIRIKPGNVNSKRKTETINSVVNFEKMVREATADPVVRKLLNGIKLTDYVLSLNILPAVFFVTVSDRSNDQSVNNARLLKEITALLVKDGFVTASSPADAGFVITLEPALTKGSENSGKFVANLGTDCSLKDKTGNQLFNQSISSITGIGTTYNDAVSDAYNALISKMKISTIPSMYRSIFKD